MTAEGRVSSWFGRWLDRIWRGQPSCDFTVPAPPERWACWDGACPIKTIHYKREPGCIRLTDGAS